MSIDVEWARGELARFLELTELYRPPDPPGMTVWTTRKSNRGSQEDIVASAHVVEQILDRVLPGWRTEVPGNGRVNRWSQHREAAQRADVALQRDAEIQERLGDTALRLNAGNLHPWVWAAARPLWRGGHFREAVTAAARRVNRQTQDKVGRRDATETALFQSVFSKDDPKPGGAEAAADARRRKRHLPQRPTRRGCLRRGLHAGIRNPNSHEDGLPELPEHEALEQLAAFSVLARWVDTAILTT
ncbi:TIGR02391 family protein [Streptomyces olivaceoviridis]